MTDSVEEQYLPSVEIPYRQVGLKNQRHVSRESVMAIFWMAQAGIGHPIIAEMFGVSDRHVSDIFRGRRYAWLTMGDYAAYKERKRVLKGRPITQRIEDNVMKDLIAAAGCGSAQLPQVGMGSRAGISPLAPKAGIIRRVLHRE